MEAIQEFGRIVRFPLATPFESNTDELVSWDLPSDVPMASTDEIEDDLALGHPSWGSLMRVSE
jgi:hypothetical protein